MKVNITYYDNDSLTVEEVVRQATHNYGKNCHVEISPDSWIAYDAIHFGLQQLITHEQLSMLYDRGTNYQAEIKNLRNDILEKVREILDTVIIENEARVS